MKKWINGTLASLAIFGALFTAEKVQAEEPVFQPAKIILPKGVESADVNVQQVQYVATTNGQSAGQMLGNTVQQKGTTYVDSRVGYLLPDTTLTNGTVYVMYPSAPNVVYTGGYYSYGDYDYEFRDFGRRWGRERFAGGHPQRWGGRRSKNTAGWRGYQSRGCGLTDTAGRYCSHYVSGGSGLTDTAGRYCSRYVSGGSGLKDVQRRSSGSASIRVRDVTRGAKGLYRR